MTVADRPIRSRAARTNVVEEIAARRRADILAEVAAAGPGPMIEAAWETPPPRPIAERLAAPGLHLIAEIKRSSPSAGRIAAAGEDIVARARAYEVGGAAAISVLCEPHWFGGSVDDLRAVRAAVAVPVLAKDFVVEEIQLPMLRAAGADLVLLLAVLHPAKRLARLVERAQEIGLEPLVEVHDARELERALASGARLIGLNNRDLRTLVVDVEQAARLRELVPDDRLVIAESGVREPGIVARWRALGFDGALVGEALVRATDPAAAVRAFVAAGAAPDDPANVARRPSVKICGITDADGVLAAVGAGADAIGLNVVPGTPRELSLDEAADLARLARTAGARGRPLVVAVTADASRETLDAIVAEIDPDVVQLSGSELIETCPGRGRAAPGRSSISPPRNLATHRPSPPTSSRAAVHSSMPASSGSSSIPPVDRIPAGPGRVPPSAWPPRSPGRCRSPWPAASTRPTSPAPSVPFPRSVSTWRRGSSARASPASVRPRIRSASRSSSSVPGRPATIAPTSRSARLRSMPVSSTPTAPAGGGWSAISVAATSPRR